MNQKFKSKKNKKKIQKKLQQSNQKRAQKTTTSLFIPIRRPLSSFNFFFTPEYITVGNTILIDKDKIKAFGQIT